MALRSSWRYSSPERAPRAVPPRSNRSASSRRMRSISSRVSVNVWSRPTWSGRTSPMPMLAAACLILWCSRSSRLSSFVEAGVGEHAADEHLGVVRSDPVDAAVALYQPHRVPRQVVVDDVAGLLEVDALGEHVGGDHDVVEVVVSTLGRVGRLGGESPDHRLLAARAGAARQGGDPVPVGREPRVVGNGLDEVLVDPVHGVGVVAEDQDLAPVRTSWSPTPVSAASAAMWASCSMSSARFGSSLRTTVRAVSANERSRSRSAATSWRSRSTS